MFSSNKRRVNLGGSRGPNRRKLLEDSRRERAARLLKQQRLQSAISIQAFVRRCINLRMVKEGMRKTWMSNTRSMLKIKPEKRNLQSIMRCVREFVFFFAWKKDVRHLALMCKVICESIKAPLRNNYLAFLGDPKLVSTGYSQATKLLDILVHFVSDRIEAKSGMSPPLAALGFLVDLRQMKHLADAPGDLRSRISHNHLRIINHLSRPQGLYAAVRSALLRLTSANKKASIKEARICAAYIFATALRPLSSWPTQDAKKTLGSNPYAEFLFNILSIPLLSDRFRNLGLERLSDAVKSRRIWVPLMKSCASVSNTSYKIFLKQKEASELEHKVSPTRAFWLTGNILEFSLSSLASTPLQEKVQLFQSLESMLKLLDSFPADFPQPLKRQLSIFQEKKFLDGMVATLKGLPAAKCHVVYRLCGSLAFKFETTRTAMLNALVFSSILEELHNSLRKENVLKESVVKWTQEMKEMFALFCLCYNHLLLIQDDNEFFGTQKPFTLKEITVLVVVLRDLLYYLYWDGWKKTEETVNIQWVQIRDVATELFRQLRVRQSRRQFCNPNIWIMNIPFNSFKQELEMKKSFRSNLILRHIPFVFTFQQRVDLFYNFIRSDRKKIDHGGAMLIRVRRDRVLIDGFDGLSNVGKAGIKGRIQVQFINKHGITETGIDGGGLFKEFVTELLKTAFDPQLGLFTETSHQFTYPNPSSYANPNFEDHLAYFRFVGMIVGKCLYDGIIIEPQLANFFLRKLLGYRNLVDDLSSLDPELYKNLLYLKKNSAEGLGLTFSVTRDVFGDSEVVDLIPDGSNVAVDDKNRLRFIYCMAHFKLNLEIAKQSNAFVQGLTSVIRQEWIRMFEAEELDRLISGTPVIDMKDLQQNTVYAGGYDKDHQVIKWFWDILDRDFDEKERRSFLKFSTSVSRSPLLGFKHLYPKFCIQRSGADSDNLPTSSTCMNLLRIPRYDSREKLKEKLMYAIKSSTGFYLT